MSSLGVTSLFHQSYPNHKPSWSFTTMPNSKYNKTRIIIRMTNSQPFVNPMESSWPTLMIISWAVSFLGQCVPTTWQTRPRHKIHRNLMFCQLPTLHLCQVEINRIILGLSSIRPHCQTICLVSTLGITTRLTAMTLVASVLSSTRHLCQRKHANPQGVMLVPRKERILPNEWHVMW